MKVFRKLLSLAIVVIMVSSFAGCHKKGEIAVTIEDIEFTSAYYMCALLGADSEARTIILEDLSDEEKEKEIDYFSHKVEEKDFVEWVKDKAIDNLKTIAAYKLLCKENNLELDDEAKTNAENYASYYWSSYGYSSLFEPNGVSESTYKKYTIDSYYAQEYFESLYGKGGEKEIAADKVSSKLYDNFLIANVLTANYTEDMSEADKSAIKTKLEGYVNDLKKGSKTFEQVYNEYNNITDTGNKEESATDSEGLKPLDAKATVLGDTDTGYNSVYYSDIKKMEIGEIKVIEPSDKSGLVLAVKKDIKADPYYLENMDMTVRHLIADEEYEKLIEDYAKELKVDINNYAVNRFKVKKIVYPTNQ